MKICQVDPVTASGLVFKMCLFLCSTSSLVPWISAAMQLKTSVGSVALFTSSNEVVLASSTVV